MNPENQSPEQSTLPAPRPWYRPRLSGRFNYVGQRLFASPTFWQNLPRKSILNEPGNKYQPKPLGDKFKKGPLAAALIVQKFFDRRGKGFARLSTGTIIETGETQESVMAQAAV